MKYYLGRLLYRFLCLFLFLSGYRKRVIESQLISRFPQMTFKETKALRKKIVNHLARIMAESLLPIPDMIKYKGLEKISKSQSTSSTILLCGHYGNWELACTILPLHTSATVYGIYKPLKNKFFDRKVKKLRMQYGMIALPTNKVLREIHKNSNHKHPAKNIYIFINDQNPPNDNNLVWVDFLGTLTAFQNGPEKIGQRYAMQYAYMRIVPGKKLYHYSINIDTDFDSESSIINQYAKKLERQIIEAPQYWLWSHKRWKRKPPSSIH